VLYVLSAISFKIYEMRKYLLLSLIISMIAIPIGDSLVIQRDRNRNEMYGEAFWVYGFSVYNMTDSEVAAAMGSPYNDGLHVLPSYLGNITYEYPVFGLVFFAIATWLYPGVGGLQPLWLNFILVLVFNLNLVLIAILLKDRIYKVGWARLFFGGYFIYGLLLSAGGGKLEPITDCLLLMSMVLMKEGQNGKAMVTLGLSIQTKIYSIMALPVIFLESPLSIIWFCASALLTIIPFSFLGASFDSLVGHFLNTTDYSSYITNPMYPGLAWSSPDFSVGPEAFYVWPPALIPLVIYVCFMLYTIPLYFPQLQNLKTGNIRDRIKELVPLYIYLIPGVLFLFRWVMPWYLFWFGSLIFLFKDNERAIGYIKEITVVGFLYVFGILVNWHYFITGPLPDFIANFPLGLYSVVLLGVMACCTIIAFGIWRWTFSWREKVNKLRQEARDRGEFVY
jgi:hypothetical protein